MTSERPAPPSPVRPIGCRRRLRIGASVAVAALLASVACSPSRSTGPATPDRASRRSGPSPTAVLASPPAPSPLGEVARVTRIVDGDTIEVLLGGRAVTVRLIGVDTPETVHPSEPPGCYGARASGFVETRLLGRTVVLELDVEERDRYGRRLAYVWVGGELFNETLLAEGYARVLTIPPNVAHVERLVAAQRSARESRAGLWRACSDDARGVALGGSRTARGARCDASYPTICIPPPPPDLDCADVPHRAFETRPPDPHRFDGDHDGEGCET